MTLAGAKVGVSRRFRAVRVIARSWRELTGGTRRDRDQTRRTLIACSGGADSSSLALALTAAVSDPAGMFVVAHIVHDMRSREESLADRDAAKALADRLGLRFVEAEVKCRAVKGNAEAAARKLRYQALEQLAVQEKCPYVAVAHHADDQLETMLMALVRGAGPRGLAGVPKARNSGPVKLIRPALGVTREAMRDLCRAADWPWREDATNLDQSKLRAAIRHRIVPELERLRPGVALRASRSAAHVKGAADLVRSRVTDLMAAKGSAGAFHWKRQDLRPEPVVVLGDLIKVAAGMVTAGRGSDRMSSSSVSRVVRAIRDSSTAPRSFEMGGVLIEVTSKSVTMGDKKRG